MEDLLCSDNDIQALVDALQQDDAEGARMLKGLLIKWPKDPRLLFMSGSLKAAAQDYEGAKIAMREAVDLAPDYAIARYQLGFLLLSSGHGHAAQETWGPLFSLASDNYLRLFASGLSHMIRNEFPTAIALLKEGLRMNDENPALTHDIQLIVHELDTMDKIGEEHETATSSTQMLLQQVALKATKH